MSKAENEGTVWPGYVLSLIFRGTKWPAYLYLGQEGRRLWRNEVFCNVHKKDRIRNKSVEYISCSLR